MRRKPVKKLKTLRDIQLLAAELRRKRRQYYLHRCVKKYARLDKKMKTVFLSHAAELLPLHRKHLNDLVNTYHYAIQTEI